MHLRNILIAIAGLVLASLLTSCVVFSNHSFAGCGRIDQQTHWIGIEAGYLVREDNDKWYMSGGPQENHGVEGVRSFKFTVGLTSDKQPTLFEVIRVDAVGNNRWPVVLHRLPKENEKINEWDHSVHEVWVTEKPSPVAPAPEIPEGAYLIRIHYRLGDKEYDAEWRCSYKTKTRIEQWQMPTCEAKAIHFA